MGSISQMERGWRGQGGVGRDNRVAIDLPDNPFDIYVGQLIEKHHPWWPFEGRGWVEKGVRRNWRKGGHPRQRYRRNEGGRQTHLWCISKSIHGKPTMDVTVGQLENRRYTIKDRQGRGRGKGGYKQEVRSKYITQQQKPTVRVVNLASRKGLLDSFCLMAGQLRLFYGVLTRGKKTSPTWRKD